MSAVDPKGEMTKVAFRYRGRAYSLEDHSMIILVVLATLMAIGS